MAVSIGLPVFNAEPYLIDAIRSVFAQSYEDWELIIVDDGSSDRSLEIAMSVDDPRVRVIHDGANRRLPFRLNQIAAEARHDYLARMDADDLMTLTRISRQVDYLDRHPHLDMVSTGVYSIKNDATLYAVRTSSSPKALKKSNLYDGRSGIVHASVLARTSWFRRNPYDVQQRLSEDYELWIRAFLNNDLKFSVLTEPLYFYREEGNIVPDKILRAYASQRLVLANLFRTRPEFDLMAGILKFHLKSLIVRGLSLANRVHLLAALRGTPVSDSADVDAYLRDLQVIRQTRVPGLD